MHVVGRALQTRDSQTYSVVPMEHDYPPRENVSVHKCWRPQEWDCGAWLGGRWRRVSNQGGTSPLEETGPHKHPWALRLAVIIPSFPQRRV